jgi:hypothetical protein
MQEQLLSFGAYVCVLVCLSALGCVAGAGGAAGAAAVL